MKIIHKSLKITNESIKFKKKNSFRSCRFCESNHWNNDCINKKKIKKEMTKEIKKILMNDANDSDDDIIQNDSNSKNYRRIISVFNSESESKSKSKNDQ